jgi:hypothetical protein
VAEQPLTLELRPGIVGGEDVQRLPREGAPGVGGRGGERRLEPLGWDVVAQLGGPAGQRSPADQGRVRHDPVRKPSLLECPDRLDRAGHRFPGADDHTVQIEEERANAGEHRVQVGRRVRHEA